MRLIATFNTEPEVHRFYTFLRKEGILASYEPHKNPNTATQEYYLWIQDEDDLDVATDWLKRYQEHPEDPMFDTKPLSLIVTEPVPNARVEDVDSAPEVQVKLQRRFTLTHFIIIVCAFFFMWNSFEEAKILQADGPLGLELTFSPLESTMIFDYPKSLEYFSEVVSQYELKPYKELKELPPDLQLLLKKGESTPTWSGLYTFFSNVSKEGWAKAAEVPMFEKISQGQWWRLFTPCLMHADFLHILFNMGWVWILGKQIEERIRPWRMTLMIVIIAIIANVAQYLASGPYFLGFSGVVVGMAGFIWVRQKKAPWEGYPLSRSTSIFLLVFVLAMCALQIITFSLHLMSLISINPTIANTAHIVGGVSGMLLGRLSFFGRSRS